MARVFRVVRVLKAEELGRCLTVHGMNIEWGSINNDLCKSDAVIMAHNFAHQIGEPVYAVETKWGWTCAKNKPSLRFGKVIECYQGKECIA